MRLLLSCLFAGIACFGCGKSEPESSQSGSGHPPVGVVKAAGYEVTLHTAPDGPRYSLRDQEGKWLAREITRSKFAATFPKIHEEVRGLWAANDLKTPVDRNVPVEGPARARVNELVPSNR